MEIRSFLFEEGIVQDLDDIEDLIGSLDNIQDYRGYPIQFGIRGFNNFPLSDEILRMKNVRYNFLDQLKPIHKLVSPEPHFIEEERNLIKNHFIYSKIRCEDDIDDWKCFQMDCEGHLVSLVHYRSNFKTKFQLSNESTEHLSNFPHLKNFQFSSFRTKSNKPEDEVTNFSLLSNLRMLSITYGKGIKYPKLLKDLGLFTNLISLSLSQPTTGNLTNLNHNFVILFRYDYIASRFFQSIQFGLSLFVKLHFSRF